MENENNLNPKKSEVFVIETLDDFTNHFATYCFYLTYLSECSIEDVRDVEIASTVIYTRLLTSYLRFNKLDINEFKKQLNISVVEYMSSPTYEATYNTWVEMDHLINIDKL